jgi:nitroreductase
MGIWDIIHRRRTVRRFKPTSIEQPLLERLADAGRLAPSAANLQPLEFIVVEDLEVRRAVFPCLKWAAYIAPRGNPRPGQEPMAYIVTLVNLAVREKGFEYDVGAAMENMILAAKQEGLGSCWLLSVEREKLAEILGIPSGYRIDCVLALGYPDEAPVAEEFTGSIKYWQDDGGTLHVPKRPLRSVLHFDRFG